MGEIPFQPNTSLAIVEDFYQEPLSEELIKKVRATPLSQQFELGDRLRNNASNPLHSQSLPQDIRGEVHVNEKALFEAGITTDIANTPGLKNVLLFGGRSVLRDPFPATADAAQTAEALRQLLPVADLVRSNRLILVKPLFQLDHPNISLPGFPRGLQPSQLLIAKLFARLYAEQGYASSEPLPAEILPSSLGLDSYTIWMLANRSFSKLRNWLPESKQKILRSLQKQYPEKIDANELQMRVCMASFVGGLGNAFLSSPGHYFHLTQNAHVLFDGQPDSTLDPKRQTPAMYAVNHQVPSLSEVSFADITKLVDSEEVFAEVRNSLNALSVFCANDPSPSDYRSYKLAVSRHATDIVAPALARLDAWHKKELRKKWAIKALGHTVGMGIDAAAGLVTAGIPTPIGGLAGDAAESLAGHRTEHRLKTVQVARGILKSLTLY